MRQLMFAALLLPLYAFASPENYSCTIKQILELNEKGGFLKHEGIFKSLLGGIFTIDRNTGKMSGLPFSTESYKSIVVLDKGGKDNSYKAIVISHEPNIWVKYIHVAEQQPGREKPFWGTDDGNKIFSGFCE